MTKRQREIFEWIKAYVAEFGTPPTSALIGQAHCITKVTAWQHVTALQRQGLLTGSMPVDRCPACGSLLRCCEPTGD